ncbi:alpha/beta hydrolase [Novosphingobium sp. SL115]|uniref:alpha/beta hydrolase n=1 Tax=Novosphingobium sp. SL115 TaxID=2995150 RepID=UPI00227386B8|nr:alpha/beta hydrolase [Novosphingobium sp. SL115]MCY1672090.1 alpha/beta hydrolase [Novosphingobium sp. SL115]
MMNRLSMAVWLACAAITAVPLAAAAPKVTAPRVMGVGPEPQLEDRFPQQPIAFPKGVTAWRDVTYQVQPGFRPQIVDIYVPKGKGPHPLVLYVHGGGWMGGHTRQSGAFENFPQMLAAFAAEGFTVASVEYRLSGEAPFPAQSRDVNAALRFLREHAGQYRIDPERVGVFGGSAGGHLAAMAGLACRETALDPASAQDHCVQAVASWYGIFDMATLPRKGIAGSAEQRLMGCKEGGCADETLRAASPLTYLDPKDPPFLLIHGIDDKVVPVGQTQQAEAAFKAAGVPVEAIYYPATDHSFIGKNADDTRKASLAAMNATFDFFHEKLGVPRR